METSPVEGDPIVIPATETSVGRRPVLPGWLGWVLATGFFGPFGWLIWALVPRRSKDVVLTGLHPQNFFLETWRALDAEALALRTATRGKLDARPYIALGIGAVSLTIMEYVGHRPTFEALAEWLIPTARQTFDSELGWAGVREDPYWHLYGFAWWSGWRVIGYALIPALVIRFVFREKIRDHGLSFEGFRSHVWIYAVFYAFVLVAVTAVSFTGDFAHYYPFYKGSSRSWFDFLAWEAMYAAQFWSLEFFFRGFWLRACRSMGANAIWAMVVPYCMIHFGKPFAECLAAILAGVVLGTLSMRTRSIWSGFLIHVSVAISMDIAALLQTSGLPTTLFPSL